MISMINPLEALKTQRCDFQTTDGGKDADNLFASKSMIMFCTIEIKLYVKSQSIIVLSHVKLIKHEGVQVASLIKFSIGELATRIW